MPQSTSHKLRINSVSFCHSQDIYACMYIHGEKELGSSGEL